jgi:predicted O-linked N-acetylglucosamine transferase (SPINDLY family)
VHLGFLGHTFRSHSCGYLLRWLIAGLPSDTKISYYNPGEPCNDHLTKWFSSRGQLWDCANSPVVDIAADIVADGVDVLIDIDSLSLYKSCAVVAALRSRPKHPPTVSWMGFAPSGMCEYVVADPFVIAPGAEHHYREKVLRMPHCYLACGGFEMSVPQYRREDLGIPPAAMVYYYGQKPMKSRDMMGTLAKVLEAAPDAHLLLKTFTDDDGDRPWLEKLNAPGRVHLLPCSMMEEQARANLLLADIALDSYPYNGTLTTLEALWAGLPVVSQHGQGWSSRQGLTLLQNAPGQLYADNNASYVELATTWAVDSLPDLRDGLIESRRTSPLWNFRAFAADFLELMEGIL